MKIEIVPGYDRPRQVAGLFREYPESLVRQDAAFAAYLTLQNYEAELAHLSEKYAPPAGRLYLALCDGEPAGCIALRRLDGQSCEMKRLYLRPAFRGAQIGEKLVRQVISDAKEIGYTQMLLDTLPFLESALRLYHRCGFYQIPCYNNSPMETSIYMRLDL